MAGLRADRELRIRALSSVGVVAVIIGTIYYGGLAWNITASLIALISMSEYYRLISKRKVMRASPGVGYIFSLIFLIAAMKDNPQAIVLAMILALCVCGVFVVEVFRRQLTRGAESYAIVSAGGTVSGVLYIAVPWACLIMLRSYIVGREILITIFACTWACDVFAYLGGRAFGTMKLCEYVSPGKTVQGFIAGLIGSLLACAVAIYSFTLPNDLMMIGFICGIAGQVGDLAESLIKRESGEKDSGSLIPGHGGMLDRFDSILFNGLLSYLFLRVIA
ncbi:MAG: phosphatidate cytidylyltransferase [Synergistaceae bacterium]|nr:phosphatidate cytidylyltransferase [Synergistaceae bacterium]